MDEKTVEQVARLARLRIEPRARARLASQLGAILEHFQDLQGLDTSGVSPSVHAIDMEGRTRPDQPAEGGPDPESILANTEHTQDGFFRVPRVIE